MPPTQITCPSSRTSCWTACRPGWTGSSRGRPTGTTSITGPSFPSRLLTSCAASVRVINWSSPGEREKLALLISLNLNSGPTNVNLNSNGCKKSWTVQPKRYSAPPTDIIVHRCLIYLRTALLRTMKYFAVIVMLLSFVNYICDFFFSYTFYTRVWFDSWPVHDHDPVHPLGGSPPKKTTPTTMNFQPRSMLLWAFVERKLNETSAVLSGIWHMINWILGNGVLNDSGSISRRKIYP